MEQAVRHIHFPAIDVGQDLQELVVCEIRGPATLKKITNENNPRTTSIL
jgi:hypothetical protein